jgi:quinol monooxygenase YgiN
MGRVAVIAIIKAKDGEADAVEAAFREGVEGVASEEGTLVYALSKSQEDPNTFYFYEMYTDDAALQAHSTGAALQAVGPKLGGKLAGRPEIIRLNPLAAKGLP